MATSPYSCKGSAAAPPPDRVPGDDEVRMDIGYTLRRHRLLAGITQVELARRAGTDQANVARIERGEQAPRADTLVRLLDACGADLIVERRSADEPDVPAPSGLATARQHEVMRFIARRRVRCVLIGALAERLHGSDVEARAVEICARSDHLNRRRLDQVRRTIARRKGRTGALSVRFTPPRPIPTHEDLHDAAELLLLESGPLFVACADHLIAMRRARSGPRDADAAARMAVVRRRGPPSWAVPRRLSRRGGFGTLPRR